MSRSRPAGRRSAVQPQLRRRTRRPLLPDRSLKAALCVDGNALTYELRRAHGVPVAHVGKLVVACDGSVAVGDTVTVGPEFVRVAEPDDYERGRKPPELSRAPAASSPRSSLPTSSSTSRGSWFTSRARATS